MKTTHALRQGSDEWCQFRLTHFGASEAAAMLGLSPKMKRSELLRMKHTGLAREFSDWLQKYVLDKGHEVEALARPHMERLVGEDLYQVTLSDGRISASCDGLTMLEDVAAEHKGWNETIGPMVAAGQMPEEHMPQCQQVLMVTGAERLLFMVSDGTPEKMAHLWVFPDEAWFQRLRDGWAQFEKDLAAYAPPPATEAAPVGKTPDTLPALRIEVTGAVTASNLAEFKATALGAIRSVNRSLSTDQDFADAEKAVKWCSDIESRLKAAKEHALSQTADIDALFKALDDIGAEARAVRLDLDKLVARRKTEVKESAVMVARRALDAHIAALNAEIAPMMLRPIAADFAGCIKGLKSVASMQDRLDGLLATTKIAAEAEARAIRANVATFHEKAAGFEFLFADLGQVVHKAADDFAALLQARIATHQAAEVVRENARRAAAEAEAQRKVQADQAARDAAEAATKAVQQAAAPATAPMAAAPVQAVSAPTAAAAPRADEPATLNLGTICGRLGFTVSAQFLADVLHVLPARAEKAGRYYTDRQFGVICQQLQSHVSAMAELYAGVAA